MTTPTPFRWLALVLFSAASFAFAETIYVSPDGDPRAPGTAEEPTSFAAALARAGQDAHLAEIVLAGGEYLADNLNLRLPRRDAPEEYAPLTIRSAEGETVWLNHGVRVAEAEPAPGLPGVFRTDSVPPGDPHMWERDARVRYVRLSSATSVAAFPASCFADPEEGYLYFRTSDGAPPEAREIYYGLGVSNGRALGIYRPGTTIQDINFRDACGSRSYALVLNAPNLTARRLRIDNAYTGILVGSRSTGNLIEDCVLTDVAQGIRSTGTDLVVRRNRITKERDGFLYRVYPSVDTGVYTYFPGSGTVLTDNFVRGYKQGFRVKAAPGRYVMRHNTVADTEVGVSWVTSNADSDTSHNIFVNADDFIRVSEFAPTFRLDGNLFFGAQNLLEFGIRNEVIRGANRGKFNLYADPRFADAEGGDWRVLPDSPALFLAGENGRPAGAFGVALPDDAAQARPQLELAFGPDTMASGKVGELVFERDPWIGGGRTKLQDLRADEGAPVRLAGQPSANVRLRAFDAIGDVVAARIAVGGQPAEEVDYSPQINVALPDEDGAYRVRVEVRNDRGLWSEPADAVLRLDRQPPALAGEPAIAANEHGLVVAFQSTKPGFAEVHFGADEDLGGVAKMPDLVKRQWESNDGGEYVETWTVPRTDFAVGIVRPEVQPGQEVRLKIVLRDEGGLTSESGEYRAVVQGGARALHVSTEGEDAPGRGREDAPFATLQYAADRALPGDRIVLAPGVYPGHASVTRGGLDEASRLTIEAETPGTVTLDAAYGEPSCVALEHAPFVTVRGIRFMNYGRAGVYAYRSPHAVVENCTFYNGPGSVQGYHAFFFYSPSSTVTRCLAVGAETALMFLASPEATVTYNTISQSLYAAASYPFSAAGTVQTNNSFTFSGNDAYTIGWRHPDEFKTFRSDYNNLGTVIRPSDVQAAQRRAPDTTYRYIMEERFEPRDYGTRRFRFRTNSKGIVRMAGRRFFTMREWREETGQDRNSIFADPKYVHPATVPDRWDWSVAPDSPNLGAGEGGTNIGAK